MKRKHKLFGNIEFVGELHKAGLLSDGITKSIFQTLLNNATFSDDTIEAGMRFLEKVGPTIEKKLATTKATKKGLITKEDYDDILGNFKTIMQMDEMPEGTKHLPSNRIKLMIKNTLQRQEEGWPNSGQNNELKTKEQIEEQELKKVEEK